MLRSLRRGRQVALVTDASPAKLRFSTEPERDSFFARATVELLAAPVVK